MKTKNLHALERISKAHAWKQQHHCTPTFDATCGEKAWVGKASMSKRHRFMIIKHQKGDQSQKRPGTPTQEDAPMDQNWCWFNVVTMGMRDVDPESEITDPDEIKKLESMCVALPIAPCSP